MVGEGWVVGFDTFVMVDWSAANSPGPVGGAENGIWVAIGEAGRPALATPHPTRRAAIGAITGELVRMMEAGRRVLVGWDFVLGYPQGTSTAIGADAHRPAWRATWDTLRALVTDDDGNRSNRFEVAAELNRRIGGPAGPFWGLPRGASAGASAGARLAPTKPRFPVAVPGRATLPELRTVERVLRAAGHQPKSGWQLYGAGSVGSQGLVGIPHLAAVLDDPVLRPHSGVWPFESGFRVDPLSDGTSVVHAEVYPSLLPHDPSLHPIRDAAQVLALVRAVRAMEDEGTLVHAFDPPDVPAEARSAAVAEEGWVLPIAVPPESTDEGRRLRVVR